VTAQERRPAELAGAAHAGRFDKLLGRIVQHAAGPALAAMNVQEVRAMPATGSGGTGIW
jgi:hypothetical protein